ncbi:MAG: VanZ family protein [Huintestinicola sp.]
MKKFLRFIPALIIMAIIFFFSAQTGDESTVLSDSVISAATREKKTDSELLTVIVRKSAHFLEYAALGAALYFGLYGVGKDKARGRLLILSAVLGGLYAVTDEIHQYFVPGRACMATDVLIDTCGAAFGAAFMLIIFRLIDRLGKNNK